MNYRIHLTGTAVRMLREISDRRIREKLCQVIDRLARDPEKQGKPLVDDLAGFRSIRAAAQRYRIIYKVEDERVVVLIVALGIRREGDGKDIYALARKLVRLGLLEKEK